MNYPRIAVLALLPITALLASACATPEPLRDLATRGAGTVTLAEESLRDYLAATSGQLRARNALLRSDAEIVTNENLDRELGRAYEAAAEGERQKDPAGLIRQMAEIKKSSREKHAKQFAKIAAENVFDPDSVAKVPTEKLTAAKKSFSVLSEELSSEEWLTLVGQYAKVISDGVEQLDPTAKKK